MRDNGRPALNRPPTPVQRTSCTTTVQGHTRMASEWVTPTVDRW